MKEFNWDNFEAVDDQPVVESAEFNWDDFESEPIEKKDVSMVESIVRGGLQGATLGFADEITSGGETLLKTLFGDDKFEDFGDNYRNRLQESREAYKAAEEANPIAYNVGDIGTGMLTGLLTGGAGAIANLGRVGARAGAKELMKLGARQGAAYGLGQSEADLTKGELGEAALDTVVGGAAGAGMGLVLPAAAKRAGKASSALKDVLAGSKLGQNFLDAKELTERGIKFLGKNQKEKLIEESDEVARDLLEKLLRQKKEGSRKIGMALDSDSSKKNLSRELRELENKLLQDSDNYSEEDLKRIQRLLDSRKEDYQLPGRFEKTGEVPEINIKGEDVARENLQQAKNKAQFEAGLMRDEVSFGADVVDPESKTIGTVLRGRNAAGEDIVRPLTKPVPEDIFQAAQSNIEFRPGDIVKKYQSMSLQDLQNLKRGLQENAYSAKLDPLAQSNMRQAAHEIDDLIRSKLSPKYKSAYESGNEQMRKVHEASDFLNELDKVNYNPDKARIDLADKIRKPTVKKEEYLNEVKERLTSPDEELFNRIADIGTKSRLQKSTESSSITGIIPSPSAAATYSGVAAGKASNIIRTPVEIVGKITSLPDQAIQGISQRLRNSTSPSNVKIANKLDEALASADNRDRLLWSLSRQPAFRQAIEQMGFDYFDVDREGLFESPEAQNQPEMTVSSEESTIDQDELRRQLLERFRANR